MAWTLDYSLRDERSECLTELSMEYLSAVMTAVMMAMGSVRRRGHGWAVGLVEN